MNNNNNNNIKLPPPWQLVNDGMGRQLYYNPMTNQQSYTPPPGSTPQPIQPQQPQQPQQMQFPISNLSTPNSSISKSLPDGWEESTDSQGRVYYIDHVNKKTSWIHPSFTHQLHQQPPSPATPTNNNNNNNTTSSKVTPAQSVPIVSKPITSPSSSYQDNAFYPSFSEYGYAPNSNNNNNNNNNNSNSNSSSSTTTTAHIPTQSKPIPSTSSNNNSSYSDDSSYKSRNVASSPPSVKIPASTSTSTSSSSTSPQGSGSKTNVLLSHISPLWDLEKIVPACSNCYSPFTVTKRRHHCRCCYREFCDACSTKRIKIPQFNYNDPVRVCEYCYSHTSSNEKTCISRLVPYLFENYKNATQQYQALLEIYDYVLTYQNYPTSIEAAIVGGLKPFLEYVIRDQSDKSETVALCCQIMAFTSKFEKVLKPITDKESLISLFDILYTSKNQSVQVDCAKVIKEILVYNSKKSPVGTNTSNQSINNNKSSTTTTTTTTTTTATTNTTTAAATAAATTNNTTKPSPTDPMIPTSTLQQFISTLDVKNKEDYQLEALKILKRLVQDENTAIAMVGAGAIDIVTPMLLSSKQGILRRVLKLLLTFIEYDQKNSDKIFNLGGALYLGELLFKQISPNYNIYILTILNEISQTKNANNITNMDGLLDSLLEPFNNNPNSKEFKELLLLVNNLLAATTVSNSQSLINRICAHEGFLSALISTMSVSAIEPISIKTLLYLSQGEKVREKLRDLGIIDPLLSVICDKSKNPLNALTILTNLAKNNEAICKNIFEVGGLALLMDIVTAPTPKLAPPSVSASPSPSPVGASILSPNGKLTSVPYSGDVVSTSANNTATEENDKKMSDFKATQYQSVLLLSMLSRSKEIVREFVNFENGNGVRTLVGLMNPTCDDQMKVATSECLCNFCDDETCAILVISEGGLTYAQALLSSNQTHIKANTLKLIQKLATHSPDIKLAISEGTSIQKMVEMLTNSNPELKKCAIFSLSELCRENNSNRDLAYKCGCLQLLVNSFNTYTNDTKTLVCLLEIISGYVQQSDQYRNAILGTDLVQSIIEYLFSSVPSQNPTQSESTNSSFIIQSQLYSVLILSVLIKDTSSDLIRKVIDSGIILSLIPMLAIKNSYLQEYTLATLKMVSKSTTPELRDTMISSGILACLSDLLFSKNESILTNTLHILIELSKSQDCGGYLLSTNAITQVSELVISQTTPQPVKSLAIQLISTLLETSSNTSNIWETFTSKSGIPGIISLLSSDNPSLAINAANALSSIVVDGPGRARVVENGGLPLLLQAMSSSNVNIACAALVTVLGLSLEDELCEMIVNLGGLKTLDLMISDNSYMSNSINIDTKLYACETIFNLGSNNQCRGSICQENQIIPQIIFILLLSTNPNYHSVACKTLALLVTNDVIAKQVVELGGVIGLGPLLSNKTDEITRISASVALTNLAKYYNPSRVEILITVNENNEPCLLEYIKILSNKPPQSNTTENNNNKDSNIIDSSTSDIRLKLQILELLELLSNEPQFSEVIENINGVPSIISLLSNHLSSSSSSSNNNNNEDNILLFKTLSIITNLGSNLSTRNALLNNGFLKQLAGLMTPPPETLISLDDNISNSLSSLLDIQEKPSTPSTTDFAKFNISTTDEEKEDINKLALNLIYTFALSEDGKHIIRNSKLINIVIRFIDSKVEDQVCFALRTIALLGLSSLNRLEILNNGGMDKVLNQFSKANNSPNVILCCLVAIYNLVFLEQNLASFIQKDCLKHLVNVGLMCPNETIQQQSILIINRHLNSSKYVEELVNKFDIITLLVNILSNASSESLILHVLKTLTDFIPFDSARTSISSKIPVQILKTLQNVSNPSLREYSEKLLQLFCGINL
ncbi:hypothetical protein ACTFIW_002667 [Dictyostelium discoideum]